MEEYTYIDNVEKLINFRKYLVKNDITKIAMDFEGEYNLHYYGEKLCLIQIFDGSIFFIIDPLQIEDSEIAKTLNNRKIIKYMYDVGSDISLVYRQYGIKLRNIFDQRILVDILNLEKKDLGSIINNLFGTNNKSKAKYQKYNWTKRPVEKEAIIYALNDVKYLFEINKILMERMISENKINDVIVSIIKKQFDFEKERIPTIFRNKEFKELTENNRIIFKKLYEIREYHAKALNIPPHNIMENPVLFDIVNKKIKIDKVNINKKISEKVVFEILSEFKKII